MFDPGLRLAKVVKTYPSGYSIDVVFYDDGSRCTNVQVLSPSASTSSGSNDLPDPDAVGEDWSLRDSKTRDMIAVVGFVRGAPVAIGFLFPQVCQMLFEDRNRMVYRHASDVYWTVDGRGNVELAHPGGAFVRIGTSPAHEDLTGRDFDKKWAISRNTGESVHIHVEQAGGAATVDIAPGGAIRVTTEQTVDVIASGAVTVESPSVTLDTPQTTCTGNLTVAKGLSVQGGGVTGPAASIVGSVAVSSGDVTADTISLKSHVHPENDNGGPTGAPVP